MSFIWATRGKRWGFRFLCDGGQADPLPAYDDAFADADDALNVCRRAGHAVALRFADPLGRRDAAGRVIPHEFVLFGALASRVGSVEEGVEVVWPLVEERYAEEWDRSDVGGFA